MNVSSAELPIGMVRWRCRRGMKELDLLLTRYLDKQYDAASPTQRHAFVRLLGLQDPQLQAYFLGLENPPDQELALLIAKITAVPASGH